MSVRGVVPTSVNISGYCSLVAQEVCVDERSMGNGYAQTSWWHELGNQSNASYRINALSASGTTFAVLIYPTKWRHMSMTAQARTFVYSNKRHTRRTISIPKETKHARRMRRCAWFTPSPTHSASGLRLYCLRQLGEMLG